MSNKAMNSAKDAGYDEYYTQQECIEAELQHYSHHFKDKIILCNCDDPLESKFVWYFAKNFEKFGLKKLLATCYKNTRHDLFSTHESETSVMLEYNGDVNGNGIADPSEFYVTPLKGDGDFRSNECIRILKEADIVVTNPPFSLFTEYFDQIIKHDKKFLVLGSTYALTYANVFPLIRDEKIWLGHKYMKDDMLFNVPPHFADQLVRTKKKGSGYKIVDGEVKGRAPVAWYTNLETDKVPLELPNKYRFSDKDYQFYDDHYSDIIHVPTIDELPYDYEGIMGVPPSYMDYHNPYLYKLIGSDRGRNQDPDGKYGRSSYLEGKEMVKRIFIQKIRHDEIDFVKSSKSLTSNKKRILEVLNRLEIDIEETETSIRIKRPEQSLLRKYHLGNKTESDCCQCGCTQPVEVLEIAHKKPIGELTAKERKDPNCVVVMCPTCHKRYDLRLDELKVES